MTDALEIGRRDLKLDDFLEVALRRRPVCLSIRVRRKMDQARSVVQGMLAKGAIVYGVNTGFGKLADQGISAEAVKALQLNLLRSHACGIGPYLSETESRGIVLLRAHVLAMGHSGVRPLIVQHLIDFLNQGLFPLIPSRGSVGASGDLIPLAHLALLLIGEGEACFRGERLPGAEALRRARISPVILEAKEGLSLVNGTQASLGLGLLCLHKSMLLSETADLAGAMSLEALKGTPLPFDARIQSLRPYPGQIQVAQHLRALLQGSEIRDSHIRCRRVQDPYSIRCLPQVHGAVRDAIEHTRKLLSLEMNSVTDNPIVFPESEEICSGGNFHGHPVALALDFLALGLCQLAVISERRIAQVIAPEAIDLPLFLARQPGLHSGLMMPQVAAAALASECKLLAQPASVDSIPTSVNQEDYVSMAMGSALKLSQITAHLARILAIELFCAAEGIRFHAPLKPGSGVAKGIAILRAEVPPLEDDRSLHHDFEAIARMILEGRFCLGEGGSHVPGHRPGKA